MTLASAAAPRRILHLSPSFHPAYQYGGPVAALYDLCRAQLDAGLLVRVLTSDADGPGRRLYGVGGRLCDDYGVPTFYGRVRLGEDIALELTLEEGQDFDPEVLKNATAAVLHYFRSELDQQEVSIQEFASALRRCQLCISPRSSGRPHRAASSQPLMRSTRVTCRTSNHRLIPTSFSSSIRTLKTSDKPWFIWPRIAFLPDIILIR